MMSFKARCVDVQWARLTRYACGWVVAWALTPVGAEVLAGAEAPSAPVLAAQLSNGMHVLIKPDARAPTAVQMVWYRIGSIDETSGTTGVAHVLEHMMFKGTHEVAEGEFSRQVAALGGRDNAFTSRDYTAYFQQVPAGRLREVMVLEANRMHRLALQPQAFAKEIKVVMEERRLRVDDQPRARAHELLMATAWTAHPYRNPVIGWMADLETMTVEDAQRWYHDWYGPANATLVVVGDVDPPKVLEWAEQTYGQVPARALMERKEPRDPQQAGVRRVDLRAPADSPYLLMGFRVPNGSSSSPSREPFALELLAALLDGGESARLTRDVVNGVRVANQAGAQYDLLARGPSLFILDAVPAKGRSVAQLETALRATVARIAQQGVPAAELERAKVRYVAEQVYKRDSTFAQAMEMGVLSALGRPQSDAEYMLAQIRAVTSAEVAAVAAKYFSDDGLTVVTLQPLPRPHPPRAPRVEQGRHGS